MSTPQINDGGPAFPSPGETLLNQDYKWPENGMTLRDWFAGNALIALKDTQQSSHAAVDQQQACSPLEAGHVAIPVMIDGRRATITADPHMPERTCKALHALVLAAYAAIERGDFDDKANA